MAKKKNTIVPLNINTLLKLFFKYPLSHFPVIKDDEIYSFVSKNAILRFSNNDDFFKAPIQKVFKKILDEPPLIEFFEGIKNIKPLKIPFVDMNLSIINFFKPKEFNAFYKNISHLETQDILHVFNQMQTPIAIFNSSRTVLFKNSSFSSNFKPLLKKNTLKQSITKKELIQFISKKIPQKIILNIESIRYEFTLEVFSIQETSIFLIRI